VCEPGQVVEVDHCDQGQLPEERIGRQIDGSNGERYVVLGIDPSGNDILGLVATSPQRPAGAALTPAAVSPTVLAHTGVRTGPYLAIGGALVAGGAGLILVSRRRSAR
jgi:LPXTG-motif cell wall-anchored protein